MSFIQPIPCPSAGPGTEIDVEDLLLCDVDAQGNVVGTAIAVYQYDETTGNPVGAPTFVIPGTNTPYVPVGTLQPCGQPEAESELLCDQQTDGSVVEFIRTYHFNSAGVVTGFHDANLDGSPYTPIGIVVDCEPSAKCTPDSNQNLNGQCGPGENINQQIVVDAGDAPNHVINQDPTADPLCGGQWVRPDEPQSTPFPVKESFRNSTFDQPGPVTQGSAPYFQLTSGVSDPAGAGWGKMSDINPITNGLWQVPTPFPSAQGITAEITVAMHDGTTPGGDGWTFVFTDGSVPPQSTAVGGGGTLGLPNWQGGYLAVVLDEYGGVSFDNGSGFAANSVSIAPAGAAYTSGLYAGPTPVAPHQLNALSRSQPARVKVSLINQGGIPYVSLAIDWNDGNGFIQYFNRFNASAAGPVPATLRMAVNGSSGGAYRDIKEVRDAVANAIGEQEWRAFPITSDPIPPCVTLVNLNASVDVTFQTDTQTGTGNTDPEAYFYLVNTATNTILVKDTYSSVPSKIGTAKTLKVAASVSPADIPNLRLYVGQDTRDESGAYAATWENLKVNLTGTGCPASSVRTIPISSPCPIDVNVVSGGGSGGGGGGTTVVNTPATFEDALICVENPAGVFSGGFRREVRDPNGTITVTILDSSGAPVIAPVSITAGPCVHRGVDTQKVCDLGSATTLIARYLFDDSGVLVETKYYTLDGTGPLAPVGPLSEGGCCDPFDLGESCYDSGGGIIRRVRGERRCDPSAPPAFTLFFYDTETGVLIPSPTLVDCPAASFDFEEEVLCDDNGPFLRRYTYLNGAVGAITTFDLAGAVYVTVGTVKACGGNCNDCESLVLCDQATGAPVQKITNGDFVGGSGAGWTFVNAPSGGATNGYTGPDAVAGTGYFTGQATGIASQATTGWTPGDVIALTYRVGTISTANASFGPFHVLAELLDGGNNVLASQVITPTVQAGSGIPQWPANGFGALNAVATDGTVTVRFTDQSTGNTIDADMMFDKVSLTQTQASGQIVQFIRTICRDCAGVVTSTVDTNLDGAPYVVTGTVSLCATPAPANQDVTVTNIPHVIIDSEPVECVNLIELIGRCDYSGSPGSLSFTSFFERLTWDCNGVLVSADTITATGTPYIPTGTVKTGLCDPEITQEILCDSNGTQFLRRYSWTDRQVGLNNVPLVRSDDLALDGFTPFTPVGAVGICPVTVTATLEVDSEQQVMCDNGTTTFLRRYEWNEATGAFIIAGDFTLAGAAYVPVGTVTAGACSIASVQDDVELIEHCDTNGAVHTTFYKRLVFDKNGALLSTTNIDASGAVYVPTGTVTVGECSTCCPFNAGTGCTNTGSGTYVSVRNSDGTFTLVDPVTGSTVLAANVVPCPATTVSVAATTLDTTIQRQTGAGSIVIAAGARSITVVVLLGAPTVTIAGSAVTAVPVGVTLTWAVDASSQTLLKSHTFTTLAGDDILVTTTR